MDSFRARTSTVMAAAAVATTAATTRPVDFPVRATRGTRYRRPGPTAAAATATVDAARTAAADAKVEAASAEAAAAITEAA